MAPQDDAGHDRHHHHHEAHHHGHDLHGHAPADFGRAFRLGILLNIGFVAIEGLYGYLGQSMALVADAGHNLSDVLSLAVAWAAAALSTRPPSPRFSYGLRGSSILAALFNAVLLLVVVGAIAWQSLLRLFDPAPVASLTVIVVAAAGIVVNGATALLFLRGSAHDLNLRGAYLHMAADAGVSFGVVVAGIAMMLTGLAWIDPLASLMIVAVIVAGTWGLLRESVALSLSAVPAHIDSSTVAEFLARQPGVASIHDLHIWPIGTADVALTAHLVMPDGHPGDAFLNATAQELAAHYGIGHAALQIEIDATGCALAPAHVV